MAERRDTQKLALARKASVLQRTFDSPLGKESLAILESEFDNEQIMVPGQPDTTHYNLGRRDVVVYIRQMIRFHKRDNP